MSFSNLESSAWIQYICFKVWFDSACAGAPDTTLTLYTFEHVYELYNKLFFIDPNLPYVMPCNFDYFYSYLFFIIWQSIFSKLLRLFVVVDCSWIKIFYSNLYCFWFLLLITGEVCSPQWICCFLSRIFAVENLEFSFCACFLTFYSISLCFFCAKTLDFELLWNFYSCTSKNFSKGCYF